MTNSLRDQASFNEEKHPSWVTTSLLETRCEGDLIHRSHLCLRETQIEVHVSSGEEELRNAFANRLKARAVLRSIRNDYKSMFVYLSTLQ